MNYIEESKKLLLAFLERLERKEREEMLILANKWGAVGKSLEELIKGLAEKESLTRNQLYQLNLYKQFLAESKNQITLFSKEAAAIISENQQFFGTAGLGVTQGQLSLLTAEFNRLPISAINSFIGISKDGTPLFNLLKESYPESVTKLTDTLLNSIALGRNPVETARLMKADMNGNLTRALTIARTEQMNVFRQSSLLQMQESGVCKGWIRIEQEDACDECQPLNGEHYDFDADFETHPNCRGACIPDV